MSGQHCPGLMAHGFAQETTFIVRSVWTETHLTQHTKFMCGNGRRRRRVALDLDACRGVVKHTHPLPVPRTNNVRHWDNRVKLVTGKTSDSMFEMKWNRAETPKKSSPAKIYKVVANWEKMLLTTRQMPSLSAKRMEKRVYVYAICLFGNTYDGWPKADFSMLNVKFSYVFDVHVFSGHMILSVREYWPAPVPRTTHVYCQFSPVRQAAMLHSTRSSHRRHPHSISIAGKKAGDGMRENVVCCCF